MLDRPDLAHERDIGVMTELLADDWTAPKWLENSWSHAMEGLVSRADAMLREAPISYRNAARTFRDAMGVRPKQALRLVRFWRALAMLSAGVRSVEVAYRCGYADQSHLNREFSALEGSTPKRWVSRLTSVDRMWWQDHNAHPKDPILRQGPSAY
ncbi:MAG: AraC family transcriptional regulator [Myxococcota bacterium]